MCKRVVTQINILENKTETKTGVVSTLYTGNEMNENALILFLYFERITVDCYHFHGNFQGTGKIFPSQLTSVVRLASKGQEKYSHPSYRVSCVYRLRGKKKYSRPS